MDPKTDDTSLVVFGVIFATLYKDAVYKTAVSRGAAAYLRIKALPVATMVGFRRLWR